MCLYSFIVELNIWKKKISMNLGLWRPGITLSKQRNISKKSCTSWQKYFVDNCLVHSARPSGMPHRCFTRGICEHAGCPRQPPLCHWQGQARRRNNYHAEPSAPRYDPAWQDQWRFPLPTWVLSSGAEQFFNRVHTSPPYPRCGRKPRHRRTHSTLAQHNTRTTENRGRVCNTSKIRQFWVGGLWHNEKSDHAYKPFSESGAKFQ